MRQALAQGEAAASGAVSTPGAVSARTPVPGAPVNASGNASGAVHPIVVEGVTKRFGDLQALGGVDLTIAQGDFFALLGPNGAGKTTLISIIAGLARADSGRVSVMGHDVVTDYLRARTSLGVVPQELVFDPFFTVRETLQISAGYYGVRRADDWIDEVLDGLGLTDKANANMRALSGGMKRRVMVAQALIHRPPVIVLDEPTAGVDIELRQSLWAFVRRLNRDGHTIVLTTHYLEEAQTLCNRVAVMKAGHIVALDDTEALLTRFSTRALVLRLLGGSLPEALQARRLPDPVGQSAEAGQPGLSHQPGEAGQPGLSGQREQVAQAGQGAHAGATGQVGDAGQPGLATWPADGRVRLALDDYADIGPMLAAIQATGATILDMEIAHADLEDVFLRLMREG